MPREKNPIGMKLKTSIAFVVGEISKEDTKSRPWSKFVRDGRR
jgi:hypothetical protein